MDSVEFMCERLRHMQLGTCNEAADLIEQQARDLAALRQDIEAQIQIAKEACEQADRDREDAERWRDHIREFKRVDEMIAKGFGK